MADNVSITGSTGTFTVATKDIGSNVHLQKIMLVTSTGADATDTQNSATKVRDVWKTPNNDSLVDDAAGVDALRVTGVTVFTVQGETYDGLEFNLLGAQTNAALVTKSTDNKCKVAAIDVVNASTAAQSVRIGLAASSLTALSSAGVSNMVYSNPSLAVGQREYLQLAPGMTREGGFGDDLLITTTATSTGGPLRVTVYHKNTT